MRNTLFLMAMMIVVSSCSKEEFSTNKGTQTTNTAQAITTSKKLCSQSTLISPQVDILMLWDNTSSFNFVNSATKASMSNLISSVSENFDYHVLTAPLVPANSATLYESQLVAKNSGGLGSTALNILKSKDNAVAGLSFTQGSGGSEAGVDRAIQVIEANRSNGIFRKGAYTIIVVISNEDDKGCGLNGPVCTTTTYNNYIAPRLNKLLCLRGNTTESCSGINPLNSSMMRFISISPLTQCASGNNQINYVYKKVSKTMYEAGYTNGWPTSNDHLSPDVAGAYDSYNLCTINFSHIFDGVNTAIKQTLLKHKYDYWPVAGDSASIDPDTIRVVRSDGKILANRAADTSTSSGYELILDSSNKAATVTNNTRYFPTAGEPFTGKMIRLYGTAGNDKIVYPDCLTVTYEEEKLTYGYIYLTKGAPKVDTIEIYLNGAKIPQNATNGWDYIGLQNTSALDSTLKIVELPPGAPSGYFIRLNGSYKVKNNTTNSFQVLYTSTQTN